MERVSVIIPVYEAAAHLEIAMDSAVSQTYENLELICAYQISEDDSLEILQKYEKKDSRIRIIYCQERGLSVARNIGLADATGKYVFFMDADDAFCAEDSIEQMVKLAEENDVDMIVANVVGRDEKNELFYKHEYQGVRKGQQLLFEQVGNNEYQSGGVWALFLKRKFLLSKKIEFYPGLFAEDIPYIMECFLKAERMLCTDQIFYKHYRWNDSLTAMKIGKWQIESLIKIYYELLGMEERIDLTEEGKRGLEETIVFVYNKLVSMAYKVSDDIYVGETLEERLLWRRVKNNYHNLAVEEKVKKALGNNEGKSAYIYGAGHYALEVIEILNKYDVPLQGILVSNSEANRKSLYGNRICTVGDVEEKDCLILIAMKGEFAKDVVKNLADMKFKNICILYDYV